MPILRSTAYASRRVVSLGRIVSLAELYPLIVEMADLADAREVLAWTQLGLRREPCRLLNVSGCELLQFKMPLVDKWIARSQT
jgi:hypothetical protein